MDQLKHRFDFKREDIKLLNIITPSRVISSENLDILPLILEFSSLVECDPDLIVTEWNLLRLSETSLSPDVQSLTFKVGQTQNKIFICNIYVSMTNNTSNFVSIL